MAYRGWLEPSLLLCLWNTGGSRGHELAEGLGELGFGEVKLKRIYPILRRMEEKGLITTGDKFVDWPAWRRYEITVFGERYLEHCAKSFVEFQAALDHFLQLYNGLPALQKSRM